MRYCIFTIVYNESFFLPIWQRYYSRFFKDIFILDNDSTDGSTLGYQNIIKKSSQYVFDHSWLVSVVSEFQKELLKSYDVVVFTEVDEFLIASKKYDNDLIKLICNKKLDFITAKGFNIIHGNEPLLSNETSYLIQRQFGRHESLYNKTLIHKQPTVWSIGFHHSANQQSQCDEDLYLAHLHYLDRDVAWDRLNRRQTKPFSPYDLSNRLGIQNAQTSYEEFIRNWPTGHEKIPTDFDVSII